MSEIYKLSDRFSKIEDKVSNHTAELIITYFLIGYRNARVNVN